MAPSRTKNPFWFVFAREFPIIAACPLPSPGRKLQRGEAIREPRRGLNNLVRGTISFCFGIVILFFMLKIIIDPPKRPVSKGRSG